jgi:hypothetical protein
MAEGTQNGGPAVNSPKRARFGVWEKLIVVLLALVAVLVIWAGITFARFRLSVAKHEERIAKATQLMKGYGETEWKELYAECMLLYDDKTAWDKEVKIWPKRVTELNPYGVISRNNIVSMYWTGGFDDFGLSLEVFPEHFSSRNEIEGPGIWVWDSRESDDPKNVYRPPTKVTIEK